LTSVTVHEIVFGLELKNARAQLGKMRSWLDHNEVITPLADDYIAAAGIRATARKQGSLIELADSLIAAIAVRLGYSVITGNTDDFQAIRKTGVSLTLENWRKSRQETI